MTQSKYIVFRYSGFCECAIVFDSLITHKDVKIGRCEAVSAGFCQFDKDGASVYGESVSLHLQSRPVDSKLVERALCINQEW